MRIHQSIDDLDPIPALRRGRSYPEMPAMKAENASFDRMREFERGNHREDGSVGPSLKELLSGPIMQTPAMPNRIVLAKASIFASAVIVTEAELRQMVTSGQLLQGEIYLKR